MSNVQHMRFDWNDAKRSSNLIKHGLDFTEVAAAMAQGELITIRSDRSGETRYVSFVEIKGRWCAAVHAIRGETIWIISARRWNRRERREVGALLSPRYPENEK